MKTDLELLQMLKLADKDMFQNVSRQNANKQNLKMDHRAKPIKLLKEKKE